MRVPGDWGDALGAAFRGRVRYRRSFNWPSQLESHERVWLVIEGVDAHGEASLNGQPLGTIDGYALPARFDITPRLAKHNELLLDIACPPVGREESLRLRPGREFMAGGPIGEVRLEICSAASIASLTLYVEPSAAPQLHVEGSIVGEADDLAVVVSAGGRELAWQAVSAGQPFRLSAPADALPQWLTPADEAQLATVECRLISRGLGLWTAKRQMAQPAPLPAGVLVPEQKIRRLLPDLQTVDSLFASRRMKRSFGLWRWLATWEILDSEVYDSLDQRGVRLVQGIRREWLERLAPRLAHHPSIAIWEAPAAAASESQPFAYGRPCISSAGWGMAAGDSS
jgi:hypothetical protein